MPFDESLAARVRPLLRRRSGFAEKRMFGGIGFLLHGNMCVGVWKDSLILRIGPDAYNQSLSQPFVREFDITGRPMTGWVLLDPGGMRDDAALAAWVEQAVEFVRGLGRK